MNDVRSWLEVFLLLNVLVGLFRVARGPTSADRIVVTQLFGTSAVAVLLLLAESEGAAPLRDVAVIFALFAGVTVLSFVRMVGRGSGDER
jgi:multicomponent Na+:H+ antiporter subunit F